MSPRNWKGFLKKGVCERFKPPRLRKPIPLESERIQKELFLKVKVRDLGVPKTLLKS